VTAPDLLLIITPLFHRSIFHIVFPAILDTSKRLVFILIMDYTGRTGGPILTLDGSFDAGVAKEVLLRGGENNKNVEVIFPQVEKLLITAQA
jgi:hypothetical protein